MEDQRNICPASSWEPSVNDCPRSRESCTLDGRPERKFGHRSPGPERRQRCASLRTGSLNLNGDAWSLED